MKMAIKLFRVTADGRLKLVDSNYFNNRKANGFGYMLKNLPKGKY